MLPVKVVYGPGRFEVTPCRASLVYSVLFTVLMIVCNIIAGYQLQAEISAKYLCQSVITFVLLRNCFVQGVVMSIMLIGTTVRRDAFIKTARCYAKIYQHIAESRVTNDFPLDPALLPVVLLSLAIVCGRVAIHIFLFVRSLAIDSLFKCFVLLLDTLSFVMLGLMNNVQLRSTKSLWMLLRNTRRYLAHELADAVTKGNVNRTCEQSDRIDDMARLYARIYKLKGALLHLNALPMQLLATRRHLDMTMNLFFLYRVIWGAQLDHPSLETGIACGLVLDYIIEVAETSIWTHYTELMLAEVEFFC